METQIVERASQQDRMLDLYLSLNHYATAVQMTINYRNTADLRGVFPNFRYCMMELYYLVRFNDTIKGDAQFTTDMRAWIDSDLKQGIQLKFGKQSLDLFSRFVEKLVQAGVIQV